MLNDIWGFIFTAFAFSCVIHDVKLMRFQKNEVLSYEGCLIVWIIEDYMCLGVCASVPKFVFLDQLIFFKMNCRVRYTWLRLE